MSTHIPADVTNLIFEYYAQIRNTKWVPFVDVKTGKLLWKVNRYSAKYDNINKLLKFRKDNLRHDITIDVAVVQDWQTSMYHITGTCIILRIFHYVNKYQMIIPITHVYTEYVDNHNHKYSIFYAIFGRSTLPRIDYCMYRDNNVHSNLIDVDKLGKTSYSIILRL